MPIISAFHNISIRRYLAGDGLQICGSVFECLKLSLRDQLGPQNFIDILRLLLVCYICIHRFNFFLFFLYCKYLLFFLGYIFLLVFKVLTYERNVVLGLWTNGLISFLLSEVLVLAFYTLLLIHIYVIFSFNVFDVPAVLVLLGSDLCSHYLSLDIFFLL